MLWSKPAGFALPALLAAMSLASAPACSSQAATPGAPSDATSTIVAPAKALTAPIPLLWKVSDADNAVYLLGSFHLLKADDYPLSADIDAAFAAADKVVFEVTPDQLADPANGRKFMDAAGYGDTRTLTAVLPPQLHEKLERLLAPSGASATQLDAYEPWFVNLSLVLGLARSLEFTPENGLDQHLMKKAAAAGKPTGGLETFDAQLQALDSSPMAEQILGLSDFLERPQAMPAMLGDMHQAWRSGDVKRLDALARIEMREKTPETYRLVNVARNDAWTPKLQAMLDGPDTDDTLVVVGALHLLGEDGVVEKLREKGYAVSRICTACAAPAAH